MTMNIWEASEVLRKMFQIPLPLKNCSFICWCWHSCFVCRGMWLATPAYCTECKVWWWRGEDDVDCDIDRQAAFLVGAVPWCRVASPSLAKKIDDDHNPVAHQDKILQSAAVRYLHNVGPYPILQDNSFAPTEPRFSQTTFRCGSGENGENHVWPGWWASWRGAARLLCQAGSSTHLARLLILFNK